MANVILNRFNKSSNLSTEIADYLEKNTLILEHLKKAKAKTQVALSDDFLDYDPEVIHHYLWALHDRLEITLGMFEDLTDSFNTIKDSLS